MRKILIMTLCFLLVLTLTACQEGFSEEKDTQIIKLLNEGKVEDAKQKVEELYNGEEDKISEWIESIDKYNPSNNNIETEDKEILEIQQGWTWKKDGDYTYIKGRVKNTGDKNITYFEVTAEYLDDTGKVLDSDYTNSGQLLKVNNMKEFEIMHKFNEQYKQVKIFVNDIRVE
jgi:hypothetical protein